MDENAQPRRRLGAADVYAGPGSDHPLGARLEQAAGAPLDPAPDVVGRGQDELVALEGDEIEPFQPDVPGGLGDRPPQLTANSMPDGRCVGI